MSSADAASTRIDRVVVPLDGTSSGERSLPTAVSLAAALDASIHLVKVSWQRPADEESAYLRRIAEHVPDVPVSTELAQGLPGPALIDVIESEGSLVCMATRGHGGIAGTLLGSVADELVSTLPVPFALVGPKAGPAPPGPEGPLVLCFDGSDFSTGVVPLAETVAGAFGIEIRVTMVLHRHGDYLGNQTATEPKRRAAELVDQLEGRGTIASLELLDGLEPAQVIADFAEEISASLIVSATHGSHGLVQSVIGSTATRIVHAATCPVLMRRPEDHTG
jgi:nucleotide-binding universal stress UspA family protein